MFKRVVTFILTGLLFIVAVNAAGQARRPINIQAGITVFGDPESGDQSYVEFPFSVGRDQFEFMFVEDSNIFKTAVFAEIMLSDTLGIHLDSASTYFHSFSKDRAGTSDKNVRFINKLSLMIGPGAYRAVLTITDVVSKNSGKFIYDRLEIEPVIKDRLCLSQIEFAYNIRVVGDTSDTFLPYLYKNGLEIMTNPTGMYSEDDSVAYIYAEIYNLSYQEGSEDSMNLAYQVFDSYGTLYQDLGSQSMLKPGTSSAITNYLDIADWKPGRYDVKVTVTDRTNDETAETSRRLVIIPRAGQVSDVVTTTFTTVLDTASLQTKTNLIRFLVDPADWIMYGTLTETGKSEFVTRFFKEKDPTPGTEQNEYLEDALQRYNFANDYFSSLPDLNDGWRSDRGRVLMQYGRCNKIDDVPVPMLSVPLQVWYYYFIDGGVYFVFQDLDEFGNFQLVHSTKGGEIYDEDWEYWMKNQGIEVEVSPKRGNRENNDPYEW